MLENSVLQKIIIDIAGKDTVVRTNNLVGDFTSNPAWMKTLAEQIGIKYISNAAEFESLYTASIKDLSDKHLQIARANSILPCINDKTSTPAIAIGNLNAIDLELFTFAEIIFVPIEIISAHLPVLVSGDFDQIEHARQYVEALLTQAWEMKANDIHIDPDFGGVYIVTFAIDDKVTPIISTKKQEFMENAIAVLQKMARVEVRSAEPFQDGQIIFLLKNGKKTEWRYHEDLTVAGKNVVIRQSHVYRNNSTLEALLYPNEVISMIREVCEKKGGMVLFCGTTGHGKSTTMTTMLLELKKKYKWYIRTIEDNPEVILDGISQVRVNEGGAGRYEYGYATAIRSSLRADIDVLLVGEIRDSLTANAAFRASLTGHLAMSTLHTNSVDAVVPRLLDLGVDKHTIHSSVTGIFVQLLVPALCSKCKIPRGADGYFKKGSNKNCTGCGGEGYSGRVPVNECATLKQGGEGFIKKRYLSFRDTLAMQHQMGNIDEETIEGTMQSLVEKV